MTNRTRSGTTLVEILVSMAPASLLMLLSVSVIHQAVRFANDVQDHRQMANSLSRLSFQLRSDAKLANRMEKVNDGEFQLSFPDGQVIAYQLGNQSLIRTATKPSSTSFNSNSYETYSLLREHRIQFEMSDNKVLELRVEVVDQSNEFIRTVLVIREQLGRWNLKRSDEDQDRAQVLESSKKGDAS